MLQDKKKVASRGLRSQDANFVKEIVSPNNDKVKFIKKLLDSKKSRKKNKMFVVEGLRLCCDAASSEVEILETFYTESSYKKNKSKISNIINVSGKDYLISENVASKISDAETSQGIFCIIKLKDPVKEFNFEKITRLIVLESIKDPSNLGTILRSADALGVNDIIVSSDCVDIYSPKVLRGSMGSVFRTRVVVVDDVASTIKKLSALNITSYATVPDKDAEKITDVSFKESSALVFGNEANGISKDVLKSCDRRVTIPMKGFAESFNVAVAASIAMWEMTK